MEPKPVRDDAGAQATLREAADRRVPEKLVERLHQANARADELRKRLEATMADSQYGHADRTRAVGGELRQAEAELEELSRQIREATPDEAKVDPPGGT